jgi:hypothetical protein
MYHFTLLTRTLSSGFESSFKKSFATLEEAAIYIHDEWYPSFCQDFEFPGDWDEEDMGRAFLKKDELTLDVIKTKMHNKRRLVLLDAYSQYAALKPFEVMLEVY